ncbi:MAG: acetoacetate decarboxylase family protein, partial [Syntrophales bacterium]|nr:acetoacetate decarboxylase family protein [Syntrophales bacterium]
IMLIMSLWPIHLSAAEEKVFSTPVMAPLYGPPPSEYGDTWGMKIMFKTNPDVLKALVPEPLVPNPDGNMYVLVHHLFSKGFGNYNELLVVAPATFEGKRVDFCIYVLGDSEIDNTSGREIWGFPQKLGTIKIEEKNGVMAFTAERGGIVLIKGAVGLSEQGGVEEENPPLVNLKMIPSVRRNAPPDVKQLTSTKLEGYTINRMFKGGATLEFSGSPVDPFHKIPIKDVLSGYYHELDFTMTYGDVLYDYLKAK